MKSRCRDRKVPVSDASLCAWRARGNFGLELGLAGGHRNLGVWRGMDSMRKHRKVAVSGEGACRAPRGAPGSNLARVSESPRVRARGRLSGRRRAACGRGACERARADGSRPSLPVGRAGQ